MTYVLRFSMKRDWRQMATIDRRCEHARQRGVIASVDRHHDQIADNVSYEIHYLPRAS